MCTMQTNHKQTRLKLQVVLFEFELSFSHACGGLGSDTCVGFASLCFPVAFFVAPALIGDWVFKANGIEYLILQQVIPKQSLLLTASHCPGIVWAKTILSLDQHDEKRKIISHFLRFVRIRQKIPTITRDFCASRPKMYRRRFFFKPFLPFLNDSSR